jgi:hypothetical protein
MQAEPNNPWRVRPSQRSQDPQCLERAKPVLERYAQAALLRTQGMWVVCADEKTSIQAREGVDPPCPSLRKRIGQVAARSWRRGALNVFAALRVADGVVAGGWRRRKRCGDFQVLFLRVLMPEAIAGVAVRSAEGAIISRHWFAEVTGQPAGRTFAFRDQVSGAELMTMTPIAEEPQVGLVGMIRRSGRLYVIGQEGSAGVPQASRLPTATYFRPCSPTAPFRHRCTGREDRHPVPTDGRRRGPYPLRLPRPSPDEQRLPRAHGKGAATGTHHIPSPILPIRVLSPS